MPSRLALLLSLVAGSASAASIYPHTPPLSTGPTVETAQEFLDAVKTVEADPAGEAADALRKPMVEWIEQTNDVTVDLCEEINPLVKSEPLKAVLLFQYMMEAAAHQLRHPGTDAKSAQVAGLQAVVDLYLDFKKQHPQETPSVPYVDGLVRDAQELGRAGLEKHTCERPGASSKPSET